MDGDKLQFQRASRYTGCSDAPCFPPQGFPLGCRPNIGEWCVSSTFPLPRYMCTPHGRQGSKLRTVRIMSIPLNLSGPFSSKIGVFSTASSYGPAVPKLSRGLAFHGVGGYG